MADDKKQFKSPNRDTWVKGKLRQHSVKWPPRNYAMRLARVERGLYKCASCEDSFKSTQVQLDHIEPVVNIKEGWKSFDSFIERLFVPAEGFQVLCKSCHQQKTLVESAMRTYYSKKRKETK